MKTEKGVCWHANSDGDTLQHSYIQACLCVPEKERGFHSVPQKQTGMFVMNNTQAYESSNRCTTDNVRSVIRPKPLLCH